MMGHSELGSTSVPHQDSRVTTSRAGLSGSAQNNSEMEPSLRLDVPVRSRVPVGITAVISGLMSSNLQVFIRAVSMAIVSQRY